MPDFSYKLFGQQSNSPATNADASLQSVLEQRPLGMAFDIDGTLSPIALIPDEAQLHPAVQPLLEQIRDHVHLAIITGRAIESGAAMVNVEGPTYIGTHGLEWCEGLPWSHPVQVAPEALAYVEPSRQLLDMAEQALSDLPGVFVERKRVGGSIHYRLSPQPEQARKRIWSLLEEPARQVNMLLSEGKCVVDVKPAIARDKGRALRRFVERFALHGVVFAGDDRTDVDAMRELHKLRSEGIVTFAIAVQGADSPDALLEAADGIVQGVNGMAELLDEMVKRIAMKFI